jgi:subtilisin family serine protease
MTGRSLSLLGLVAAGLIVGCSDSTEISHAPNHLQIVSGTSQAGDLSKTLDSALVVRVLDGADKPVSGVPLTWTVSGGGSLSTTTSTTDKDGTSKVVWTLGPSSGVQAVTVTSAQIVGGSVAFLASNGATITGVVTPAGGLPFGAAFSRSPSAGGRFSTASAKSATPHHRRNNSIIIGFNADVVGVAAAGSMSYRSMSTARAASSRLQQRLTALMKARPLSHAVLSPAILAARLQVDDTTQIGVVMQSLSNDPSVAWVERDEMVSIHDGAPHAISAKRFTDAFRDATAGVSTVANKLPTDPFYWQQTWATNMIDLPRAWAITTGSSDVTVAVVDMGVRFDHPDIAANLTHDGYDFVRSIPDDPQDWCDGGTFTTYDGDGDGPDADPTDPDDIEFDDQSGCWFHSDLGDHGLWTAGIIGAVGNEGTGIAGVNWNVRIRPIRVLDISGSGSLFDVAQGVLYAAGLPAAGADGALVTAPSRSPIINMSLGGSSSSTALRNAITSAYNAGSLIVASAGNDGLDIPVFPASYTNVMAVGAVGQDGGLATYSNGGTFISVAAPGGDFRFDDNGGGGIIGPGWDFTTDTQTYLFGYGTSAAAPYVSGIAALLLAQTPTLTNAELRSRIEQFATRPAGVTRSDIYGWGIVNAYNALTQQNGPPRQTYVRLLDATTGLVKATTSVGSTGSFTFTRVPQGAYYLQAGDDEAGDSAIGIPGRRFAWAGGFGAPTVFNSNGNALAAAIVLGTPTEVEPNDDIAHANMLVPGSYVVGNITPPDARDVYSVTIATPGVYVFETSGVVGGCGLGIELDTFLSVANAAGVVIGSNDNFSSAASRRCSRVSATLQPGLYYVTVAPTAANTGASRGRYRLEVRAGG